MSSNYELRADLLMVLLGAQIGCSVVGFLQTVSEQTRWCFFGFQEMLLTFERTRAAASLVCMQTHCDFH